MDYVSVKLMESKCNRARVVFLGYLLDKFIAALNAAFIVQRKKGGADALFICGNSALLNIFFMQTDRLCCI